MLHFLNSYDREYFFFLNISYDLFVNENTALNNDQCVVI